MPPLRKTWITLSLTLGLASTAHAGMTVVVLTDIAKTRLDVLSFFILTYLLLAWAVKGLWNHLAKGFDKLPRITYPRALSLLLIAGLFMYVILTMISGARELLTPGAWKKKGIGYELTATPVDERRLSIERLKTKLWHYAESHDGKFPASQFDNSIPGDYWHTPDNGILYSYEPGHSTAAPARLIAHELSSSPAKLRYVLLSNGSVEMWDTDQILTALKASR